MNQPHSRPTYSGVAITIIVFGLLLSIALPWAFTHTSLRITSFMLTGQIGDTIGGIAGPILNFTGLLLLYLSFRDQQNANAEQSDALVAELRKTNGEQTFNIAEKSIRLLRTELDNNTSSLKGIRQTVADIVDVLDGKFDSSGPRQSERILGVRYIELQNHDDFLRRLWTRLSLIMTSIEKSHLQESEKIYLYDLLRSEFSHQFESEVKIRFKEREAQHFTPELRDIRNTMRLLDTISPQPAQSNSPQREQS